MGTIAKSLQPTFENVTKEFIPYTMYKFLLDKELPNFRFKFLEPEAIEFIKKILNENSKKYESCYTDPSTLYQRNNIVLESIMEQDNNNSEMPVMIVHDYKTFFELLREYYEESIKLFFQRTNFSAFTTYEQKNCFELIWLRATPEDFNHPEEFLRISVAMLKDNTFSKYDKETYIGKLDRLENHQICVQNKLAHQWDEAGREFRIRIYDKKYYYNTQLFNRPHYTLPVIRYGIYEKDGKKICHIGSIQDKNFEENGDKNLHDSIKSTRADLNKGKLRHENYKEKVEPAKTLALSIFVNFLHKEGITEIEAPGMLVLDYEYHKKRGQSIKNKCDLHWTEEKQKRYPELYQKELEFVKMNYQMEDTISEIKTERLVYTVKRLLSHYPNGSIHSFPGDVDSLLRLTLPKIRNKNDINGDILQQMYSLVDDLYVNQSR